jgi:hypothetical protein
VVSFLFGFSLVYTPAQLFSRKTFQDQRVFLADHASETSLLNTLGFLTGILDGD